MNQKIEYPIAEIKDMITALPCFSEIEEIRIKQIKKIPIKKNKPVNTFMPVAPDQVSFSLN